MSLSAAARARWLVRLEPHTRTHQSAANISEELPRFRRGKVATTWVPRLSESISSLPPSSWIRSRIPGQAHAAVRAIATKATQNLRGYASSVISYRRATLSSASFTETSAFLLLEWR